MILTHAPFTDVNDHRFKTRADKERAAEIVKEIVSDAGYFVYQWEPYIGIMDATGTALPPDEADTFIRKITKNYVDTH